MSTMDVSREADWSPSERADAASETLAAHLDALPRMLIPTGLLGMTSAQVVEWHARALANEMAALVYAEREAAANELRRRRSRPVRPARTPRPDWAQVISGGRS